MEAKHLKKQLEGCTTDLTSIFQISGSPALSIGVFHNGRVIHTKHFGHRDAMRTDIPDDDSVYHIASLSKLIALCAVGTLVQDGLLDWDLPIYHYLPEFRCRNDDLGTKSTLRDLAANQTGLPAGNIYWGIMKGEILLPKSEFVSLVAQMKAARPFRDSFVYSSWNYCLIQLIAEKVTRKSFGQIMKEKILDPLELNHSTFEIPEGENVMAPHAVRDNGTVVRDIPSFMLNSEQGLSAVAGGKMSLADCLKFFSALLSAYEHQETNGTETTPHSPFAQLRQILAPHSVLSKKSDNTQHYCLGTYHTILPGNLSCASYNSFLLQNKIPTFAKKSPGTAIYHHTGNKAGYFSSMFLVPSTQSGVVCLTNSTPLMDPIDFCAQMYLSVLLGLKPEVDFVSLARNVATTQLELFKTAAAYLEKKKTSVRPTLPLSSYAGTYMNEAGNFLIAVKVNTSGNGLHVSLQNSVLTTYELLPWDGDTFYWEIEREREICDKGMFPVPIAVMHLMRFAVVGRSVESLYWRHEMAWKEPECFGRVDVKEIGRL
jgi:CubicO group peptidase (beta-lactamase class C family)